MYKNGLAKAFFKNFLTSQTSFLRCFSPCSRVFEIEITIAVARYSLKQSLHSLVRLFILNMLLDTLFKSHLYKEMYIKKESAVYEHHDMQKPKMLLISDRETFSKWDLHYTLNVFCDLIEQESKCLHQ